MAEENLSQEFRLKNIEEIKNYWTLDVSQTASYEIALLCLLACLSLCPSLCMSITNFSQDWVIRFSDIVHGDR